MKLRDHHRRIVSTDLSQELLLRQRCDLAAKATFNHVPCKSKNIYLYKLKSLQIRKPQLFEFVECRMTRGPIVLEPRQLIVTCGIYRCNSSVHHSALHCSCSTNRRQRICPNIFSGKSCKIPLKNISQQL